MVRNDQIYMDNFILLIFVDTARKLVVGLLKEV